MSVIEEPSQIDMLQAHIAELERKLAVAREALEYYGNRMDSGATARKALEEIK